MVRNELSECELIVMKCIWDASGEVTCQEIIKELKEKYGLNYKDTTVYTFLKNLRNKGFVDSYRRGVTFFYAKRGEEDYKRRTMENIRKFWFHDSKDEMLAYIDG